MSKITSLLKITAIFMTFFLITSFSMIVGARKDIILNWKKYRCLPWIIPFASFLNPCVDGRQNMKDCLANSLDQNRLNSVLGPIGDSLKSMGGGLSMQSGIMDGILNGLQGMFSQLAAVVQALFDKIGQVWETIVYMFIKFRDIVNRCLGLLQACYYGFITVASSIEWIFIVPKAILIGVLVISIVLVGVTCFFAIIPACAFFSLMLAISGTALIAMALNKSEDYEDGGGHFCFDADTYVNMAHGMCKPISQLKCGDTLAKNETVKGVIQAQAPTHIYRYNGILVTGRHLVLEKGKWIRIENSSNAVRIHYHKPYIYCLITTNHTIGIGNLLFRDYEETDNPFLCRKFDEWLSLILNFRPHDFSNRRSEEECGLCGETMIDILGMNTKNKSHIIRKKLKDVHIGEKLSDGSVVTGLISQITDSSVPDLWYMYKNTLKMTGNQLVKEQNEWIPVRDSRYAHVTSPPKNHLSYHLFTKNHRFSVGRQRIELCDYLEEGHPSYTNNMDRLVCHYLNQLPLFLTASL